jgi:hypothetical protein
MKRSEKILAGLVGGLVGALALGFGIKGFFSKPLKEIDKQTAALREKLNKLHAERRDYFNAEDGLRSVAQRTFAPDLNQASARSGEMIGRQIALAGLNEADFTRLPVGPRRLRGASEIGWSVQGKGDLTRIVNLLFLLENAPQVHRIESVTLTSYEKPGEIKVRFLFLTLVLEPAPEFQPKELKPKLALDSPERLALNSILERDLLRPYIKLPPPPANRPGGAPSSAPPGPESFKVVSLSEWEGQPEVHIRDQADNRTIRYKPGDTLKDNSQIVAVDYRPLPLASKAGLLSHSRVILKIGSELWAVERGQTLAEKRKLDQSEWPESAK